MAEGERVKHVFSSQLGVTRHVEQAVKGLEAIVQEGPEKGE
jgi:hypothetical protein